MVVISRALRGDRQHQAAVHPAAVDQHGAGTALAVVAALLGAGQTEMLAQGVEQRRPMVDVQDVPVPVDVQGERAAGGMAERMCRRHPRDGKPIPGPLPDFDPFSRQRDC